MCRKIIKIVFILLFVYIYSAGQQIYAQKLTKRQQRVIKYYENKISKSKGSKKIKYLDDLAEYYLDINPDKSIDYANKALKLGKSTAISSTLKADLYNTLGAAYFYKKKYRKSTNYYEKELKIIKTSGNKRKIGRALYNLGTIQLTRKKYNKAKKYFQQSLDLALKLKDHTLLISNYKALYDLYTAKKNYKEALKYYKKFVSETDAKLSYDTRRKISILRRKYSKEKRKRIEAEETIEVQDSVINVKDSTITIISYHNALLQKDSIIRSKQIELLNLDRSLKERELRRNMREKALSMVFMRQQRRVIIAFAVLITIILAISFWLYRLNKKISEQNKTLAAQKEEIAAQRDEIERKNVMIIDSLNYARKIQESILVPEQTIKKHFPEMFIFYRPRDIVSGDFYWFSQIENRYVFAAIDCTGHGVPGAFLSMIGNMLLNEIVNHRRETKPDKILTLLHLGVLQALHQDSDDEDSAEDGMDMSLCTIDVELKRFQFAGAKNHLYVIQGDKLKVLKANYHSIGGRPLRPGMEVKFTSYDFMFDRYTKIYMLSDGYLDQFGGEDDTKFNTSRFKNLLIEHRNMPMEQQKMILEKTFLGWKGNRQQIDDILVVGIDLASVY